MFHNAASEEMLLFNNFRPAGKADVQKALKFRYTKLLNKWLFDNQRDVKILIRDTLGKQLEKKIDKHDLFGFVFLKSEYSIPLTKIPNYLEFFCRYLQFGVYFKVPCPSFQLTQDEEVSLLTEAETVNPETVLWLVDTFNVLLPPRLYHQYRNLGLIEKPQIMPSESKFDYISKLIDMESPYHNEIRFDAVTALQLAIRYNSMHYLQYVESVSEADVISVTPSSFRFTLLRKYVEFNPTCKYKYLCELIDNNIKFNLSKQLPITLLRLTLQYNSLEYLQYIQELTSKDCQNITQPMLRVAVVKKYLECNSLKAIQKEVGDMDTLFKNTLKSVLALQLTRQFCDNNKLFSNSIRSYSDFEWVMYKYRRFRKTIIWSDIYNYHQANISSIRNFNEELPHECVTIRDRDREPLLILEWFRLGEGQPVTWCPEYMFDLNLFDQNVIKTLMTLQLIPECILNCLPNELIFTIFDMYMFSFKK